MVDMVNLLMQSDSEQLKEKISMLEVKVEKLGQHTHHSVIILAHLRDHTGKS